MTQIQITVQNQVDMLAKLLERDHLAQEARTLQETYARRLIWDQMALRLSEYLNVLLHGELAEDTKLAASILRETLRSFTGSRYEDLVYRPARELAGDIEKAGFAGWEKQIAEEIARSFTAGEVFDALRASLNRFLSDTPNVPAELKRRVQQFVSRLS